MATKAKKTTKRTLTFHELAGALSFWGTAVRTLLFGFLAAGVFFAALSEAPTAEAVDNEILNLIYVLGSYLLLDFGYVMVARVYKLEARALDMLALAAADAFIAMLYIVPKLVVDSRISLEVNPLVYVAFIPIVVIALRALVGMLFGKRR